MKKKKSTIQEEVQKTMGSIERIERIEGNPFLFTRVMEQIKSGNMSTSSKNWTWQAALMTLLIVLNVFTSIHYLNTKQTEQRTAFIQTLVEDYDLGNEASNYYLNE